MEAVIGLLLMIPAVSRGAETYCDGRQDGAHCYGALGGTVVLRLMDSASDMVRYIWSNNTRRILHWRKNMLVYNLFKDRSSFSPADGTFRINNLSSTDAGEYTLTIIGSNRRKSEERTLQLTIKAPASSVLLVSECLSQGEMRVSCSSEGGDSPQYSWTLDGRTLTDAQILSGNSQTSTITLKQDVSGLLVCSVSSHVNHVSVREMIASCGFIFIDCIINGAHISKWVLAENDTLCTEPATASVKTAEDHSLLVLALRAAVVILILTATSIYFVCKKKKQQRAECSAVLDEMDYENSVVMTEMRSSWL